MRVVVIVLAVLLLIAILYFAGVGRSGLKTCVRECESTNCIKLDEGDANCTVNEQSFEECVSACREKHKDD